MNRRSRLLGFAVFVFTTAYLIAAISIPAQSQIDPSAANTSTTAAATKSPAPAAKPPYEGYRGVQVGMTMDEARKPLGNPKEKSDSQDYYKFSDKESAQVLYGSDKKVFTISVTYLGNSSSVPTTQAIFGESVSANADGSINKKVKYDANGFSVTYYKTGGDDPITMITTQKILTSIGG